MFFDVNSFSGLICNLYANKYKIVQAINKLIEGIMHIYFSGVGGVAIGPLARIAQETGYRVTGSDSTESRYTRDIAAEGIEIVISQTYEQIASVHAANPIDWFVYTSALPQDHPELQFALKNGIKASKRDEFITHVLKEQELDMIAVAGTHGKTNTTGMLAWLFRQFKIPVSYSIGTNIPFGPNGQFQPNSKYFLYEADEFDKNFLKFDPAVTVFTSVDYDHPETYPSVDDYKQAFRDFADKSDFLVTWRTIAEYLDLNFDYNKEIVNDLDGETLKELFQLPGNYTRQNAYLAMILMNKLFPDISKQEIQEKLNSFPGTERRMELLAPNIYSDYAHHPVEIKAALQAAKEFGQHIVVVYQPHQNIRQHAILKEYTDSFEDAQIIYWLPTYLSREYKEMPILTPQELITHLSDPSKAIPADMNIELIENINTHRKAGHTVLLLSAGNLDDWAREYFVNLVHN